MTRPTPPPLRDLRLARAVVDRSALLRNDQQWLDQAWAAPGTQIVQVNDGRVAMDRSGEQESLLLDRPVDVGPERRMFLGVLDDVPYFAAIVDAPADDDSFASLREVGSLLGDRDAGLVVHAISLANWHRTHTHCPRCGGLTEPRQGGHVRRCTEDGSEHYPRTDPAVIMSVVDADDRLLLGQQVSWGPGRFSTLAGFVEPGESLEAAVRREVAEEAGIAIGDVHYLGSQPWPFPSSLMLGFLAEATSTEVTRHDGELADARWFTRESLLAAIHSGELMIAPTVSIARRLIEHWYGAELPTNTPPFPR